MPDAERELLAGRLQHVAVVDEDALGGLGPQVRQARFVLDRAQVGPQQAVEVSRLGEGPPGAAVRAGQLGKAVLRRVTVLLLVRLDEVIGPEALVAGHAFRQRVGELGDVAAGLPHLAGQDHRGVEAHDVVAFLHHRAPPLALDVVLHLDAERPVVPGRAEAAVDLAGREDDPPPLAQADQGLHAVTAFGHQGLHPAGGRRLCSAHGIASGRGSVAKFSGVPARSSRIMAPGSLAMAPAVASAVASAVAGRWCAAAGRWCAAAGPWCPAAPPDPASGAA